jgi:hypothetical protein
MHTPPSDQTIILNLLRGAVPERADEISSLWKTYGPKIEVAPSATGVTMNADRHRIRFDTKTIDLFWLVGFSAWRSIEVYAPAVVLATLSASRVDQALSADQNLATFERDYKDRIAAARSVILAEATSLGPWPPDLPQPQADRARLSNPQDQAAFDLVALALAFALLHEFRHVMFLTDGNQPGTLPEEELACDVWARAFMSDKLAAYARAKGHDFQQVLSKRAAGLALSAIIVHAITPTQAHWGNSQYPPVGERIEALIGGTNLPPDSSFWVFAACLLVGIMRQEHRPLDVAPRTARELVETLIDRLR